MKTVFEKLRDRLKKDLDLEVENIRRTLCRKEYEVVRRFDLGFKYRWLQF